MTRLDCFVASAFRLRSPSFGGRGRSLSFDGRVALPALVVAANAGTHQPSMPLMRSLWPSFGLTMNIGGYGSRIALAALACPGRRLRLIRFSNSREGVCQRSRGARRPRFCKKPFAQEKRAQGMPGGQRTRRWSNGPRNLPSKPRSLRRCWVARVARLAWKAGGRPSH
jgi:hypothetical protein